LATIMYQSHLFTKTRKEAPKDEVSKNAELLIRAGYIHKEMAGVYAFLPLGLRVLKNIEAIVREEMDSIGGQEIELTALQEKKVWEKTSRWDDRVVDNWFKTKLKNDTELGLAFTHEEPLTIIMRDHIRSYNDLPRAVYQFQTKFRNETRAKSGIMRGREFLMKDLYSFSKDDNEHVKFYENAKKAYRNIFNRVGIGEKTFLTFAPGGTFSKFSHEFQTMCEAGEDVIYVSNEKSNGETIAINKEIDPTHLKQENLDIKDFKEMKAVEVGNIFSLGTRFSEALGLTYLNEKGEAKPVVMGSYGIGIGRLMGTIVEVLADEKGIVWPESIAPFKVHLISVSGAGSMVTDYCTELYHKLTKLGVEVLYDDRDVRPGEKFADSDLIGIPIRAVVSEKTMKEGVIEIKNRKTGEISKITEKDFLEERIY
jgi:prolyl-tRNA synthetase